MNATIKDEDQIQHTNQGTTYLILWALCISHLFNDTFQSLIAASYPLLKDSLLLSFTQIGLIATTFQFASSIFQPIVGWYTDKHPQPYSLPIGMSSTLAGIILLSQAWNFPLILVSVAFIGFGSAVFHPESSRIAYIASGGRFGLAQSLFQVGGNAGSSLGPLLAAILIAPYGQKNIVWFGIVVFCSILFMIPIGHWYAKKLEQIKLPEKKEQKKSNTAQSQLSKYNVIVSVTILLLLVFSKNVYTVSLTNFYTFYLIEKFNVSVQYSQIYLFIFLFAVAAGTIVGGPVGDKIGRKYVIWVSILGAAPFTLLLPYVNSLWGTCLLTVIIGAVMASSFPAILIYAQELVPGKVGTIAGLFFGFSFGIGGIASAFLGGLADHGGIELVYDLCSFMPLLGMITWFLPNIRTK
ncbi:MAG: MFS transporter [Planctomycetaceae bacterium]|jgi:FSR family fosmidomycin resistance protein-like MFS transporter|nr:MFS transporter [Planctomycetaceae bacterium]